MHVQEDMFRLSEKILHSGLSMDIGDFVGIHEHGGCPVADGHPRELHGRDHRAFNVEMGIHKTGAYPSSRDIQNLEIPGIGTGGLTGCLLVG